MGQNQSTIHSENPAGTQWTETQLRAEFNQHQQETLHFQAELHRELMLHMTWRFLYPNGFDSVAYIGQNFGYPVEQRLTEIKDFDTLKAYLDWDWDKKFENCAYDNHYWQYWLETEINERYYHYFEQFIRKQLGLPLNWEDHELEAEIMDVVLEMQLNWAEESQLQLEAVNFYWMIKTHQKEAERMQAQNEMRKHQIQVQAEAEAKVAQRVQQQACFVLKQTKYGVSDYENLIQGLEYLAQVVTQEELMIYLKSRLFAERVSNTLRERILNLWTQEQQC